MERPKWSEIDEIKKMDETTKVDVIKIDEIVKMGSKLIYIIFLNSFLVFELAI